MTEIGVIEITILILGVIGIGGAIYQRFSARRRERFLKDEVQRARQEASRLHSDVDSARAADAEAAAKLESPELPEDLIQACARGQCILFVGSAYASATGRPTRHELIQRLAQDDSEAMYLVRDGDIDGAVDVLTGADTAKQQLRLKVEIEMRDVRPVDFDEKTMALIPFRSAITSNWTDELDHVWPDAETVVPQQMQTLDEHFSSRSASFILTKLYGRMDQLDTVLLSTGQLLTAIRRNRSFQRFIATQFLDQYFFFCGATLSEIQAFLSVFDIRESRGPHFALMPYVRDAEVKREYFEKAFGIRLLLYKPNDETEIAKFIHKLRVAIPAASERPEIVSRKLRSLRLRNIGAFMSMELEFDPQWNILLGNNGCGKSTIVKAIAAGLCGEEEEARIPTGQMLRTSTNDAEIDLTVGKQSYETRITRTSSGIEITSQRATPLERGNWPVLGFPALRGSSAASSTVQRSHAGRPSINDVLPVLSGMADKRMGVIKRWIIDLEGDAKRGDERANNLVALFFDLIQDLTPGTRFKRTKDTSEHVEVETSDGNIPIDLISQGMSSVVAWVGELLHRLTVIYPDDSHPEQCEALVLVDELDAHMHPSWQQRIARTLKERFPNVQFIATTHSPLIVAGMPVEQVIRLERDEDGTVTRMDVPADMTMGRADQILAGSLFDLETTLDIETQELMNRYHGLLAMEKRTPAEERSMMKLKGKLEERIPPSPTAPTERRALEMFRAMLDSQIGESRPEMKDLLLEQAEELLKTVERERRRDS